MSVYSLRPRVSNLVFQLYGRPLHPEFFDILAVRKIQREDYELTVRITRTGHVITWENRDVSLTEVTAAADQPLPEKRRLLSHRLRGEHCDSLLCAHGISYQMSFQVEVLPQEVFLHVHDEIIADGGKRGLLHNFQPNHRLSLAPGLRDRRGPRPLPVPVQLPHLPRRAHGRQIAVADREEALSPPGFRLPRPEAAWP